MKLGVCTKCGKNGKIVMHHTKGYEGNNKDFVLPYCQSCHKKIHFKARKEGRCLLTPSEANKASILSSYRRMHRELCKNIIFRETLVPNIELQEHIQIWPTRIYVSSYFQGQHGKKLYEVDI